MRRQDKKKNMEKVNKLFQERFNADKTPTKPVDTYKPPVDIYPNLSKVIK
tara:strand:+ start:25832 stop:25981 length:150 start_codon:yes stop_codon:yes gene_type:complete